MTDVVAALAAALNNDMDVMRAVSQNLANVNTSAYKREITYLSSFEHALQSASSGAPRSVPASGAFPLAGSVIDMQQGPLQFTGNSFNLGLEGSGFLVVETAEGSRYTRKGSMQIDAQGRLALVTGEPVLGESGFIYLRPEPFEISSRGLVSQNGLDLATLKLIEFEQPSELDYLGEGFFSDAGQTLVGQAFTGQVMQGYIEKSNVQTADEVVRMIEATRHFQTTHKVLQGYDGMLDTAINVLGDLRN